MSIVKMKRLRLIGLQEGREELLRALQDLGCVQIDAVTPAEDDPQWAGLIQPDSGALEQARAQYEKAQEALKLLQETAPEKRGLLTPLPRATRDQLFDRERYEAAAETADRLREMERELTELDSRAEELEERRRALAPWLGLEVPLDTPSTASVEVIFGSLPVRVDLDGLMASLGQPGELCDLTPAGSDRDCRYFLLLCHKTVTEPVLAALRAAGFNRVSFRESGTAASNDAQLGGLYQANRKRAKELREALAAAGERRRDLELCADRALQEVRREEAKARLLDSDAAYFLSGWFPAEDEQRVAGVLNNAPCAWECGDPAPEEYPQVPIQLRNNRVTAALNPITEMYSMPAYDGVDPNPLMAPFFILFFGFMMNDIAYGLLMALGTAVYLKLKRPKGGTRDMMTLFLLCGVSSVFWGCLTGSFFGDFLPQLFRLMDPESTFVWFWKPLFSPVNDTILVMIGSMALGAIQVFSGMAINVVETFKKGDPWDAVFNEISWWIVIGGGAWAILGGGTPALIVLAAGGLMLVVGGTRKDKGFGKVAGAIGILYNGVSGFFSDILSYLRLMALMMAGSIIAQVFNTLGAVFGLVPFLIIALFGNVLNLVLNLLGCYVHTLRLQCLEFFGRFYKDGGKAFRPLNVDTQYTEIIEGGN